MTSNSLTIDTNLTPSLPVTATSSIQSAKQYDTERIFPVKSVVSARPPLPPRTSSASTTTLSSYSPIQGQSHSRNNSLTTASSGIGSGLLQFQTPVFSLPTSVIRLPELGKVGSNSPTLGVGAGEFTISNLNVTSNGSGSASISNRRSSLDAVQENLNEPYSNLRRSSVDKAATEEDSIDSTRKIPMLPNKRRKFQSELIVDKFGSYYKLIGRKEQSGLLAEADIEERVEELISPGQIQDFGVLIVFEVEKDDEVNLEVDEVKSDTLVEDKIRVLQVSENSTKILSLPPSLLLQPKITLTDYLTSESVENLLEALETILEEEEELLEKLKMEKEKVPLASTSTFVPSPSTANSTKTSERFNPHRSFVLEGFGSSYSKDSIINQTNKNSDRRIEEIEEEEEVEQPKSEWKVFATLHKPVQQFSESSHFNADSSHTYTTTKESKSKGVKKNKTIYLLELELCNDILTPLSVSVPSTPLPTSDSTFSSASSSSSSTSSACSSSSSLPSSITFGNRSLIRKEPKGTRGRGEEGMNILSLLSRIEERMIGATDLDTFYQITVDTIAEITGFERIIMEQFDSDGNALVVAEHNSTTNLTKYLGLTFPASDFPYPTYDKLEIVYDINAVSSKMCCRINSEDGYTENEIDRIVDMRLCVLRGVEESKIRYLKNLSVKSTTTLSLSTFAKSWGLISLQSSTSARRPSISNRQILSLLIESINSHLERFSYKRRLNARKFINGGVAISGEGTISAIGSGRGKDGSGNKESRSGEADTGSRGEEEIASVLQIHKMDKATRASRRSELAAAASVIASQVEVEDISNVNYTISPELNTDSDAVKGMEAVTNGYIVNKPDDLLLLFDADFACLSVGEEVQIFGEVENTQDLFGAVEYFRYCGAEVLESSQSIALDFPDLQFKGVGGILFIPLGESRLDFLLFFRLIEKSTVLYAGDPHSGSLSSPRSSFEPFEVVLEQGRSREWKEEEIETAEVLSTVYGKFLDVWREKQVHLVANQVTALLLSNTSHEVRTPLNAVINYLEIALDSPTLDDKTRKAIQKSRQASLNVRNVVNDLVDLARVPALRLEDAFVLASTISDSLSFPRAEALRKDLNFEVDENPQGTPLILVGDRVKLRKVIATVASNAVKHTKSGTVRIEYGEVNDDTLADGQKGKKDGIRIGIVITDTGSGIPEDVLNSVLENFEKSGYSHLLVDTQRIMAGDGLDLSVVARIVASLGGQLKIQSKVDQGSKITLILPFRLPAAGISENDTTQLIDAFQSNFSGISVDSNGESVSESTARALSDVGSLSSKSVDQFFSHDPSPTLPVTTPLINRRSSLINSTIIEESYTDI